MASRLQGLTEEQAAEFFRAGSRRRLEAGEVLFTQGERSESFAFVEEGALEVVLPGDVVVATVERGQEVGAMGALSDEARSATLRALSATEVLVFDAGLLREGDASTLSASTRAAVLSSLLQQQSDRVRVGNAAQLEQLKKVAQEQRDRLQLGSFVTHVIALMCMYGLTMRAGMGLTGEASGSTRYTVLILIVFMSALLAFIWRSGERWESFGVTTKNLGRHAAEGALWSVPLVAGLLLLKWVLVQWVPAYAETPLFSGSLLVARDPSAVVPWVIVYAAFCPAQEFVARGALQGGLTRFLAGDNVKLRANILANLMFSASHAHISPGFTMLVLLPGVFWGWMFARQGSLAGVTVSHIILGVFFIFFLGYVPLPIEN